MYNKEKDVNKGRKKWFFALIAEKQAKTEGCFARNAVLSSFRIYTKPKPALEKEEEAEKNEAVPLEEKEEKEQTPVFEKAPVIVHTKKTQPISIAGYFFSLLILLIPGINIIAAFIWAFISKNKNRNNFGKAALLIMLIGVLIFLGAYFVLTMFFKQEFALILEKIRAIIAIFS